MRSVHSCILGVAHAYALAKRGRSVVVFERSPQAAGASVRNFGMIWPIGQPAGCMHDMALRSRELWLEALSAARLPYFPTGSLHVVYRQDEACVAQEFCGVAPKLGYQCGRLNPEEVLALSHAVRPKGCWARSGVRRRSPSIRGRHGRISPGF